MFIIKKSYIFIILRMINIAEIKKGNYSIRSNELYYV